MATRGIRLLVTLPIITVLLAVLPWWAARDTRVPAAVQSVVMTAPDQTVTYFMMSLLNQRINEAARCVSSSVPKRELRRIGRQLDARYGPIAETHTEVRSWTADQALVLSWTKSMSGDLYIIPWTLVRKGNRWIISDYQTIKFALPDFNVSQ